MLERWRERDVFRESVRRRQGAEEFVFYEGPPTANGRPGSHHVLARVFKDIFPRYQTMLGKYVERKGGWDCHGLPVEIAVEQKLGFHNKHDIERYGIAEFNAQCRESVFEFLEDWTALTERIGYWVDLEHPYRTLDPSYIESVWWALKTMWDRDLLFEGHRVVPYCVRCGTALSSHEVAQGYEDVEDPSIYVTFPVTEPVGPLRAGDRLLAWTTTPWTVLSHAALAVSPGPDLRAHRGRLRARRGARGGGAGRGRAGRRALHGRRHDRHPLRAAVRLHQDRGVRAEGPHRAARRLRQRRGRHRHRPLLDRVRRGRLPARPGAGHQRDQPRQARRDLRRPHGPLRRPLGQGGRPRHRRGPALARAAAARRDLPARLPALLALRHAAALLRQAVVVRRHVEGARPPAGRQRDRRVAPGAHQARALRALAREQRRLGDLARALLGHAAAGVALQERPRGVHRLVRRAGGEVRRHARGPAPALRRRADLGLRGVRRADAARAGGDRRLVRLGLHAVRPAPRAVRERGRLRAALPRELHLRGDRPDARLVLLADRRLDAAVRPVVLRDRALPRPHRRSRGQEDVEVARQHRPAVGRHRRSTAPTRSAGTS